MKRKIIKFNRLYWVLIHLLKPFGALFSFSPHLPSSRLPELHSYLAWGGGGGDVWGGGLGVVSWACTFKNSKFIQFFSGRPISISEHSHNTKRTYFDQIVSAPGNFL